MGPEVMENQTKNFIVQKFLDPINRENSRSAIKSNLIGSIFLIFLLAISFITYIIFEAEAIYRPSFGNIALWTILLVAINQVRNLYARYTFMVWAIWFIIGSISLFSKNQIDGGLNYKVNPDYANYYYLSCVSAAVCFALILQAFPTFNKIKPEPLMRGSNPVVWSILVIFPALYALSIIVSTGGIPMLSGSDVSAEMYQVNYGPLHDFGIIVSVVCVMIWEKLNDGRSISSKGIIRLLTTLVLVFYLAAAAFDGRRALTMFAIAAMMLFYVASPGSVFRWIKLVFLGVIGLIAYASSATLRAGGRASDAFANFYAPLATVGTEYRDFIYGFVRLNQVAVQNSGYDWLGSTMATMTPSIVTTVLGIDKVALVKKDSARSLMAYYNVDLGVRIGLPGELWFAYGWWGIAVFALFGPLVLVTAWFAVRTDHYVNRALLLTFQALWALSILGQSSVTFGVILTMIYTAIAVKMIEFSMQPSFTKRRLPKNARADD